MFLVKNVRPVMGNGQKPLFQPLPKPSPWLGTKIRVFYMQLIIENDRESPGKIIFSINNGVLPNEKEIDAIIQELLRIKALGDYKIQKFNEEVWDNVQKTITTPSVSQKNLNPPIPGWIYVWKQDNYYKIGKSIHKDCRQRKYITENPRPLKLVCKKLVKNYNASEKALHLMFSSKRHHGEWFNLEPDDILTIKAELSVMSVI